ncbi:MAG: ATP-binding protein [Spirochaetales bacterium]|nr:ATP-binding protein [Spirochaetales bacterium]
MIDRTHYLNKLVGFKDKQLIKVITGIRRCGKSTLLEMYQKYLNENGISQDQIISINFEDMDNVHLTNAKSLHQYVTERLRPGIMNYIFLDEIQIVEDFPKVVDSLYIKKHVDLYITGSNAYLLSSEIATLLSGRYIEIQMLPLSFKEYISFVGDADLNRKYTDYLRYSSFPYTVELDRDTEKIRDYLGGIYHTVILKDVMARNHFSDVMMLESVTHFMFDTIGNLLSTKKIADTMTSAGRKISTHTVESYITALINSFILHRAKRYDVKGKQYLKTLDKYYLSDIGLRFYLLGNKGGDVGHILENVVYLELIRRDYDVYVGKVGSSEVDFIAMKQGGITYYQVALTVREKETLERELAPLMSIPDHYTKVLITLDDDPAADYKGIRQINALDFLME